MIKVYLWILKLLSPLWKILGADTDQLLLILKTKAELVLRAPVSINARKKAKDLKLPSWARELLKVALSSLFGLIYCPFLFIPNREIALLYAVFLYLATITMSMIMTFSTQLIDTTDNIVLLPRPIKDSTMVLYRLLFGIYQFLISAIPMAIPMIVILSMQSGIIHGLYFFALLLPVLVLVFALLQMLVMLLLNIFTIRMFNKLIVWLQGSMLIIFFICCRSSFFDKVALLNLDFTLKYTTLLSFMPPFWIVSIWLQQAPLWMYFVVGLIPLMCLLFIVIVLAPKYSSKLSQLSNDGEKVKSKNKEKSITSTYKKKRFFILKNKPAQSTYVFMHKYMSRTKEFKMSALSSFYYVAITTFPVLMNVFKILQGQNIVLKNSQLLFPVYSFSFPLSMAILAICGSSHYKASWAVYAAPDNIKGSIKFGSGWAVFTRLFVPAFLIWSIIALVVSKMQIWSNLIFAFSNMLLLTMLFVLFMLKEVPLSIPADEQANKGMARSIRIIITMLIGVAIGAFHIFLVMKLYWWVHILLATLNVIATWLVADKIVNSNE